MIGLSQRRTEDRQHGVADELVQRAFFGEDRFGHLAETLIQEVRDVRRRHTFRAAREADDVGEQDRDVTLFDDQRGIARARRENPVDDRGRVVPLEQLALPRLFDDARG